MVVQLIDGGHVCRETWWGYRVPRLDQYPNVNVMFPYYLAIYEDRCVTYKLPPGDLNEVVAEALDGYREIFGSQEEYENSKRQKFLRALLWWLR